MDQRVLQFDTVYGGGDSRQKLIELQPVDIRRLNNALVANITKEAMSGDQAVNSRIIQATLHVYIDWKDVEK